MWKAATEQTRTWGSNTTRPAISWRRNLNKSCLLSECLEASHDVSYIKPSELGSDVPFDAVNISSSANRMFENHV